MEFESVSKRWKATNKKTVSHILADENSPNLYCCCDFEGFPSIFISKELIQRKIVISSGDKNLIVRGDPDTLGPMIHIDAPVSRVR